MPTLLELQRAMRASVVEGEPAAFVLSLATGVPADRLDIYGNTIFSGLTKALRLAFPAVERLVGAEFFGGAADAFIRQHLPRAAYLDQYGGEFPDFLGRFPPATSLSYLADVAALEWAMNCALHAPDETPLELSQLAILTPQDQGRVSFRAHPSVSLLRSDFPIDDIWRAVLSGDDHALAALDLAAGPVFVLVERGATGIEVTRMEKPAWKFLDALCRGEPLHSAIDSATDLDAPCLLAEHLAVGRFVAFTRGPHAAAASPEAA
jgi:Putative DNA-binding domain